MAMQFFGIDIMGFTKDTLDTPVSQTQIDALIDGIVAAYPTITHIGVSVPMNTNAEAFAERGSNFGIDPAVYAARFCSKIHAVGKGVLWRGTDCYFEGIYGFPVSSKLNGHRYTYIVSPLVDNFSGDLSNWLTAHQAGNDWSIVNGEMVGPAADGWRRTALYNAAGLINCTMVAKVKKVGNQQIVLRATTDPNFPGYGFQIRTGEFRLERPGLENLASAVKTFTEGQYYWIKGEVNGTTIRGKVWADGASEPGSWDISITNSQYTNGYCGISGETSNGVFDDVTITPTKDADSWITRSSDWINTNITLFQTGDILAPFPEASGHQTLTNDGNYNQFFEDLKFCLDYVCSQHAITCYNGLSSHLFTGVKQGAIGGPVFTVPGIVSFDHYGSAVGLGKRFSSREAAWQLDISGSDTYTVPLSITETSTSRCDFIPEKISYNDSIDVYIVNKGTGDWTMTIHDASNNLVKMPNPQDLTQLTTTGVVTIPNASLTNNAWNTFSVNWDSPTTDTTYHFHLTSTVADGTVRVLSGNANNLNQVAHEQFKANANPTAMEIDLRRTYALHGLPLYLQEWGDYWSTDPTLSDPVRNQAQHEAYLDSMYAVFQRLVNEGILIGFNYWRAVSDANSNGGHERVMQDTDPGSGWTYANTYEGDRLAAFLNANLPAAPNQKTHYTNAYLSSTPTLIPENFDAHQNFSYSTVATVNSQNSVVIQTGEGALFPTPPFNATIWPRAVQPKKSNATIRRVTGVTGDILTFDPAIQEGVNGRTIAVGDQISATITRKALDDIENVVNAHVAGVSTGVHGLGSISTQDSDNVAITGGSIDTTGITLKNLTSTQRDALAPASGMMIYNTTLNQVQRYENSAWRSFTNSVVLTVGTANADYVCDGVADNVEIQAALDSLPLSGGTVYIKSGTYNLAATINMPSYCRLVGEGYGTTLRANGATTMIKFPDVPASPATLILITIENLRLYGNNMSGIGINCGQYGQDFKICNCYFHYFGSGSKIIDTTTNKKMLISGNFFGDTSLDYNIGINLSATGDVVITGNEFFRFTTGISGNTEKTQIVANNFYSTNNTSTGACIVLGTVGGGLTIANIVGNTFADTAYGIKINQTAARGANITGNFFRNCEKNAIFLRGTSHSVIGNYFQDVARSGTGNDAYGILSDSGDLVKYIGNSFDTTTAGNLTYAIGLLDSVTGHITVVGNTQTGAVTGFLRKSSAATLEIGHNST